MILVVVMIMMATMLAYDDDFSDDVSNEDLPKFLR